MNLKVKGHRRHRRTMRGGFAFLASLLLIAVGFSPQARQLIRCNGEEPIAIGSYKRTFDDCGSASKMACVVDGDTFWIDDFKVRISDIDTPELSPPRCEYERQLGLKAKARLRELLNSGRVTLEHVDRDEDRYGRKLRTVRNEQGESIGAILVSEGVARQWDGARHPWCP